MSIISIVPRLSPAIDGVGDYALRLAHQLEKTAQTKTHFIVGDPQWDESAVVEGFTARRVESRSVVALWSALTELPLGTTILLHYVGHGYAKRGCPRWLVQTLEHWQRAHPQTRLVTMFHELYAVGLPWQYDFWFSLTQQNLAARIAKLSDRALTSTQRYANSLNRLSQGKHAQVPTLPIFSNMGEPPTVLPLAQRQPRLIVFGQHHTKARVYRECLANLASVCRALNLKEIWDLGPSTGLGLTAIQNIPIVEMGSRSPAEISAILATSAAGFLHYDPRRLAKSGIFAAYCAHGLLPVNYQRAPQIIDGLAEGTHYWTPPTAVIRATATPSEDKFQAIATHAYDWYQTHRLDRQAITFADCLFDQSALLV